MGTRHPWSSWAVLLSCWLLFLGMGSSWAHGSPTCHPFLLFLSVFHCFFCKRPRLSRLEEVTDRSLSSCGTSSHVLVCLHSPVLGQSFLSNSLPEPTPDRHQTRQPYRNFFPSCHNCMATPYNKSRILYHYEWLPLLMASFIDGWQTQNHAQATRTLP